VKSSDIFKATNINISA